MCQASLELAELLHKYGRIEPAMWKNPEGARGPRLVFWIVLWAAPIGRKVHAAALRFNVPNVHNSDHGLARNSCVGHTTLPPCTVEVTLGQKPGQPRHTGSRVQKSGLPTSRILRFVPSKINFVLSLIVVARRDENIRFGYVVIGQLHRAVPVVGHGHGRQNKDRHMRRSCLVLVCSESVH